MEKNHLKTQTALANTLRVERYNIHSVITLSREILLEFKESISDPKSPGNSQLENFLRQWYFQLESFKGEPAFQYMYQFLLGVLEYQHPSDVSPHDPEAMLGRYLAGKKQLQVVPVDLENLHGIDTQIFWTRLTDTPHISFPHQSYIECGTQKILLKCRVPEPGSGDKKEILLLAGIPDGRFPNTSMYYRQSGPSSYTEGL